MKLSSEIKNETKQLVMQEAWKIFRAEEEKTFSQALKKAWRRVKNCQKYAGVYGVSWKTAYGVSSDAVAELKKMIRGNAQPKQDLLREEILSIDWRPGFGTGLPIF